MINMFFEEHVFLQKEGWITLMIYMFLWLFKFMIDLPLETWINQRF